MRVIVQEVALKKSEGKYFYPFIQELPTINAAPIVHARWEYAEPNEYGYRKPYCGHCGEYHLYAWADHKSCNYCPNCGAKMDGGER